MHTNYENHLAPKNEAEKLRSCRLVEAADLLKSEAVMYVHYGSSMVPKLLNGSQPVS